MGDRPRLGVEGALGKIADRPRLGKSGLIPVELQEIVV